MAVVELFSPIYDEASGDVTYEVEVLENWEDELAVGLSAAPADLVAIEPSFGTAHLFIDGALDCPNGTITCMSGGQAVGTMPGSWFDNFCSHELIGPDSRSRAYCVPCRTPADVLAGPPPVWKANISNVWAFWGNIQRANPGVQRQLPAGGMVRTGPVLAERVPELFLTLGARRGYRRLRSAAYPPDPR